MKVFKILIFGLSIVSFGLCFAMESLTKSCCIFVPEKKIEKTFSRKRSHSLDDLNALIKNKIVKKSSNNKNNKHVSPRESILKGNVCGFIGGLANSLSQKKVDKDIIHLVLISPYLNNTYSRTNFLKLTIDVLRAYCSPADIKRLVNNKCMVEFGNGYSEEVVPLKIAIGRGDKALIELLIDAGADTAALSDQDKIKLLNTKVAKN